MRQLRGLKSLVHEAVDWTTELVRDGHESSARSALRIVGVIESLAAAPGLLDGARRVDELRREGTDLVLGAIRAVNGVVRDSSDVVLDEVQRRVALGDLDGRAADPVPLRSDVLRSGPWLVDGAVGLLNGVLGDHLHRQGNPLSMGLRLRHRGGYLPRDAERCRELLGGAGPKLAVFVHGLGATEWSWWFEGAAYHGDPEASFATLLERDLGYTPLLVRYNTGRHVSESGRELARELQRICDLWPVPLEEIVLIGHSMGGLVVRSACHYADGERDVPGVNLGTTEEAAAADGVGAGGADGGETTGSGVNWSGVSDVGVSDVGVRDVGAEAAGAERGRSVRGRRWVDVVTHVFCLGSPHQGAPLEKLGAIATALLGAIDAPGTRIPARIARARSAGIKDMRHGCLVDEDWLERDPDALGDPRLSSLPPLRHARYAFVSATFTVDAAHPLGRLLGDLIVQVPSASGPASGLSGAGRTSASEGGGPAGPRVEEHTFPIETAHYGGVLHHQLQNHPALYARIRDTLRGARTSCDASPRGADVR